MPQFQPTTDARMPTDAWGSAIRMDQEQQFKSRPAVLYQERATTSTSSRRHTESRAETPRQETRTLLNLCLGVLGRHFEHVLDELDTIAEILPASQKLVLLAIARRKGLLSDKVLLALVDDAWESLDVSGSNVTDLGMEIASKCCHCLKVVDISQCDSITSCSVQMLVEHCPMLQTLRCGGTLVSNEVMRKSLRFILPRLDVNAEAEDSWEDLEHKQVGQGARALRWLVWPTIDQKSLEYLLVECPKVVVNPFCGRPARTQCMDEEVLPDVALDSSVVGGIDPITWASKPVLSREHLPSSNNEQSYPSIAERFKLAFAQRDERLAPKRAKNLRQNQRRAEKAWLQSDANAKAVFWAGVAHRSLRK